MKRLALGIILLLISGCSDKTSSVGHDGKVETRVEENKDSSDDYENHLDPNKEETVLENNEDPNVVIDDLTLSPVVTLTGAFNSESSTNFRGVFDDNRVFVSAYGGQLYHYELETGGTFTYENFIKDSFVDSKTGNLVFTREIKEEDINDSNKEGDLGLYRVLKEYPEDELIFTIPKDSTLEQAVFFKEYILLSFTSYGEPSRFTRVIPLVGTKLDGFGNDLESVFTKNLYRVTTDGERLLAYDVSLNEVVDLTSAKSKTIFKPSGKVRTPSLDVFGDSYLFSYVKEDSSSVLIYNDKELIDDIFPEVHFYDKNYAFVTTAENLKLLHLNSGKLDILNDISMNVVVSETNVYFLNNYGEILKIKIEKNAQ